MLVQLRAERIELSEKNSVAPDFVLPKFLNSDCSLPFIVKGCLIITLSNHSSLKRKASSLTLPCLMVILAHHLDMHVLLFLCPP